VIRRRLVVAVVVTIAAVLGVAGVVVVRVLENRLVEATDHRLIEVADRIPGIPGLLERGGHAQSGFESHALIEIAPDGKVRSQIPSGPVGAPDPLPDIAGLTAASAPVTLPSTGEDGPDYRAVGTALADGGTLIVAVPLTEVEATLAETRRILLVAGAGALAIAAAIVWFSIRRGLRPIDDMIQAAERIADGELTARTTAPDPASEVGHLSAALNTMLDRIEQAMAARTESEARMRRFVADASHELRTPLTSIRGYAELHRQGATSPEEVTRGMARIEREAEHMAALVGDLLLLARLDQGRALADDRIDLTRIVEETVADARTADPRRSIVLELSDEPAIVRGDRLRLRQVLDNLLANIRDHTDPGTTATVTLADSDGTATLIVADNGPGMTPDEAAHAFARFWQAEPTATHARPGTGLGLAIVAELVAAHGGTIALDTSPGAGTSFTITLPTANDEAGPELESPLVDVLDPVGDVLGPLGDPAAPHED
jgi:two-component system OmpR family sensor kinase